MLTLIPAIPSLSATRFLGALGLIAGLAFAGSSVAAPARGGPIGGVTPWHQGQYINLHNAVSDLCLGVRGVDSHAAGTGAEVYHCVPGSGDNGYDNQWKFVPVSGGYYQVQNRVSGLCLGVRGVDSHGPGTEAEAYTCNPGNGDNGYDNQWTVVSTSDGYKQLKNRVSGLCLGVVNVDSHGAGAMAEVYHCDAVAGDARRDELWRFTSP